MATSVTRRWTCPTCQALVTSPFCPECGERELVPRDLTLRGLLERVFQAVTNVDGRALRTLRDLLLRPGLLAVAYLGGKRKPYLGPIQVFLLANVLFFAVQSVSDSSVFGARLDSHLHQQDWQSAATTLVAARLEKANLTLAQYAPVFDRAVEANAKSLVVLMTIPFALLLALLFRGRAHPFITHATLSLHVWSFALIVFSLALLIADVDVLSGGAGLRSARMDNVLSTVNVVACAIYVYVAVGAVYGAHGLARVAKSLVLTLAVGAIVLGYRFLAFLITLFATT